MRIKGSHLLNMVLLNENIDLNEHKVTQNISARRIMFTKGIQSLKKGIRYTCHNNVCMFSFNKGIATLKGSFRFMPCVRDERGA